MSNLYHLDDLGWFQFERLIQSLLKQRFSAGIEAWGGHHDWGCDAYYQHSLPFPDQSNQAEGPLVFQVKFISGASAAGAEVREPLKRAVAREAVTASEPVKGSLYELMARSRLWKRNPPKTYAVFTNAHLTASLRSEIMDDIQQKLKATPYVFGQQDISAWLDNASELRQAYPQLLGLRDLRHLIETAIAKPILARSNIALGLATELSKVFVPTIAYEAAWRTLLDHHFVVLEGPPEVGKSAIARTIALTQHSNGWDSFECTDPTEVLQALDPERHQIFVADDAFGSTEYDAASTARWARELDRLLRATDARHWLIWTARKHILEMALRHVHLQGASEKFPKPGDILIDVGAVRPVEKATMLYRHARNAILSTSARIALGEAAPGVVADRHFTPERVRLLVQEIANLDPAREFTAKALEELAANVFHNPTASMRKTWWALPPAHRSILISMLEVSPSPLPWRPGVELDRHEAAFRRHLPLGADASFQSTLSDLTNAFVRRISERGQPTRVDWIHPSLRDLVIEEIRTSTSVRKGFLERCGLDGFVLALSVAGGHKGSRNLPFLVEEDDWILLRRQIPRLMADAQAQAKLLRHMSVAVKEMGAGGDRSALLALAQDALRCAREQQVHGEIEDRIVALGLYYQLSVQIGVWSPSPPFESLWNSVSQQARQRLAPGDLVYDGISLLNWVPLLDLLAILKEFEPRFLRVVGWPGSFSSDLEALLKAYEAHRALIQRISNSAHVGW